MSELHVVLGAGPIGKWTARELVKLGQSVRIVNRSGRATELPSEIEVVKGDAYSAASVAELTKGATAVYQAAQPEYSEWPEKFPPLQAAIVEGVAQSGAKLIVVENLYSYGDANGQVIRETTPANPQTKKGQVRHEMTKALLAAHQSGKLRVAIGRASNFYGPEYMMMGDFVFYPALAGKSANLMGNPDAPHSFTYTPDFGKALAILGTRDEALGQIWHVPNAPAISQRAFVEMLYKETGHPAKFSAVNRWMMRLFGLFNPGARETVEMMYEWEKPFVVDSSKFEQAFGMKATPIEQGLRETVAWFKAHPKSEGKAA